MHFASLALSATLIASTWAVQSNNVAKAFKKSLKGNPILKNATLKGVAIDPTLNRDACGSVKWADRLLWVCRDTQPVFPNGTTNKPAVWAGSASYTNLTRFGPPFIPIPSDGHVDDNIGYTHELLQYGNNNREPFYVLSDEFCGNNTSGKCPDGTRYPRSPDSPPLITSEDPITGAIVAYTWVKNKHHSNNINLNPNPSTALYKVTWSPQVQGAHSDILPKTEFVSPTFWADNEFSYGSAGNLIVDGYAYLWAQTYQGGLPGGTTTLSRTSLARVHFDAVEDISRYEYYRAGVWTSERPANINVTDAFLNATAGGQGTFYYSRPWRSYVWLGGGTFTGGEETNGKLYVSTAPRPEGPWTDPEYLMTVLLGNNSAIPAYGFQANRDIVVNKESTDVYFYYTMKWTTGYQTPVYLFEWEEH